MEASFEATLVSYECFRCRCPMSSSVSTAATTTEGMNLRVFVLSESTNLFAQWEGTNLFAL